MIDKIEIEKAKTLLDQNNIGEAIALLEKLVEDSSNENKDVAYYVLGNAYRRGNNWQNAINSYSRAIEINPSSVVISRNENTSFHNISRKFPKELPLQQIYYILKYIKRLLIILKSIFYIKNKT